MSFWRHYHKILVWNIGCLMCHIAVILYSLLSGLSVHKANFTIVLVSNNWKLIYSWISVFHNCNTSTMMSCWCQMTLIWCQIPLLNHNYSGVTAFKVRHWVLYSSCMNKYSLPQKGLRVTSINYIEKNP